jgi:hypothetical protein
MNPDCLTKNGRCPFSAKPVQTHKRLLGYTISIVVLLALFMAGNLEILSGARFATWDADAAYAPYQMLISDFARAHDILLWNPWVNAGSPDGFEPQLGAFSPITILFGYFLGGNENSFRAYWLFLWFSGGLGMMFLGWHLRVPPWAAFIASTGYMFSGLFTGQGEHTSIIASYASLPWIIWRLDAALAKKSLLSAVQAGAIWGLYGLSGYPGIVITIIPLVMLFWTLGRLFFFLTGADPSVFSADPHSRLATQGLMRSSVFMKSTIFSLMALSVAAIVSAIILAPSYYGFLVELRGYSDRASSLSRDVVVHSNAFSLGAVKTFASPFLPLLKFSNPALWAPTDISGVSLYVGPVVLWLALASLFIFPRLKWLWWVFISLVLFFLALAMGDSLPLRGWLFDLFPPSRFSRHACLFRGVTIFGLCVMAMECARRISESCYKGKDQVTHGIERQNNQSLLPNGEKDNSSCTDNISRGLIIAGVTLWFGAFMAYFSSVIYLRDCSRLKSFADLHLVLAWPTLALIGFYCLYSSRYYTYYVLAVSLTVFAISDGLANMYFSSDIYSTNAPAYRESWTTVRTMRKNGTNLMYNCMQRTRSCWLFPRETSNKCMLIGQSVLKAYTGFVNRFYTKWLDDNDLVAYVAGPNRTYFAPRQAVSQVSLSDNVFEAFKTRKDVVGCMPLLVHSPASMQNPVPAGQEGESDPVDLSKIESVAGSFPIQVHWISVEARSLSFLTDVPEAGYILVTDRWAPGWVAKVNGHTVPVLGGNFVFRAIEVPAGLVRVEFEYRPFGYPMLLLVSWSTLLATLTLTVVGAAKRFIWFVARGEPSLT